MPQPNRSGYRTSTRGGSTTRRIFVERENTLTTFTTLSNHADIHSMTHAIDLDLREPSDPTTESSGDSGSLPDSAIGAQEDLHRVSTGRFPRTVTCAWCGNRYGSAVPLDLCQGTQGCGCASDVRTHDGQWIVVCGYGSENDMDVFRFVANEPTAPADPICDECIRERLCCGDLVRLGEYLIGEDFTATLDHLLRKPTP